MAKKVKETSLEAYHSLDAAKLSETKKKIIYALSQLHEATTEEVAAFLKVEHDRVWKRFSELAKDGLIKACNKRPLKSGRNGYTYVLAQPVQTVKEATIIKEMVLPSSNKTYCNKTDAAQGSLF